MAVPLNPEATTQDAIGSFRYAGGLALTSPDTDSLHGLSAIAVADDGQVVAVGDLGIRLTARLVLDDAQRLAGVAEARLERLTGEDGQPLIDKEVADAEGLALLPNGDLLVSFERHARILRYPAGGGTPRPAPAPAAAFASNGGMEGLAPDPDAGDDAYVVGAEETGETWTCRLASRCVSGPRVPKDDAFGLTAMARLPDGRTAYVLRAYDPAMGTRIAFLVHGPAGEVARMEMAPPMTIDNFEGVAAVPRPDGSIRFYLLSDDNASDDQRTLLLAFDWHPPPA